MKKVFQTIVDKDRGNCMQAAVASLFDKELNEVPNFIELGDSFAMEFFFFFENRGYNPTCIFTNKYDIDKLKEITEYDGGIDGYFYATIPSKTYDGIFHAVIIDKNLNVVHDPNPNQKALDTKPNEIVEIMTVGNWHFDFDGNFVKFC